MPAQSTKCKRCGAEGLFWTKSAKGRWYLCNPTSSGTLGTPVPCPWSPHKCDGPGRLNTTTPEVAAAVAAHCGTTPDAWDLTWGLLLSALHAANPGANHNYVETAAAKLTRPSTA